MSRNIKASKTMVGVVDSTVDMTKRAGELEARRLLAQLLDAKIPESVCDDNATLLLDMLYQESWAKCDVPVQEVLHFIQTENKRWANGGYRILIEGGVEKQRRRMLYFCLYRAILARFSSFSFIAKVYDWPTLLPILGDYRHPGRQMYFDKMQSVQVLALTEIDTMVPMTMGGIETILTSILRGRMLADKPTLITLKRPYRKDGVVGQGALQELVEMKHDVNDSMVVRIKIKEEN